MTDLSTYSLADLRVLQSRVAEQITARIELEKVAAREQILAIAQRAGVPLKELLNGASGTRKPLNGAAVPIRFQNPDNRGQQWSGRGRQPQWVKEWLNSGKPLDQLKVG
jgi:DNA-binding protein H-NS